MKRSPLYDMRNPTNQSIRQLIRKLIILIVYLAYLQPAYFDQFSALDLLFNSIRVSTFLLLLLYFLLCKKVSRLFVCSIAYSSITFLMTVIQGGDVIKGFRLIVIVLGVVLWSDYLGRRSPHAALSILNSLLTLILCINFLTIILFPNGLYHYTTETGWSSNRVWFLGLRNSHIKYLGLGCFCSGLKYLYSDRGGLDKFRVILVHGITILTVIDLDSGAGYVMLAAYFLMLVAIRCFRNIRIDFSVGIIFHVVLFVLITLFSATMLFSDFFELFGKNGTASNRITLWAAMWAHIFESPILGHGYMVSKNLRWLQILAAGATTGHNAMLDMAFQGGLVTVLSFVFLLFEVRKRMARLSQNIFLYNYAVISFVAFFLSMQSEGGMDSPVLFLMIGMLSILPNIHSAEERKHTAVKTKYTNHLILHFTGNAAHE